MNLIDPKILQRRDNSLEKGFKDNIIEVIGYEKIDIKDLVKDPIVIKTNKDKDLAKYYLSIKYNYGLDDIRSKLVKYVKSNITIDSNLIDEIIDNLIVEYEDIEEYIEL